MPFLKPNWLLLVLLVKICRSYRVFTALASLI